MPDMENMTISEIEDSPEKKLGEMIMRTQMAIRTGKPDREQTADLVMRAMGARSRRKFAEELGANVSSVSRILNGQVNEISPPLLAKIGFHADSDCGVTLDKLMEAQGLCDPQDRQQLEARYVEECRRIIVDELLRKGYSVRYESEMLEEAHRSRIMPDFTLRTNALGEDDTRWLVECKMMSQHSMFPIGYGRSQIWMDSAMAYYYRGGQAGRISLVVDHRTVFEQIKERMSELSIPNEVSVILISPKDGKTLDEYIAPLSNGRVPQQVFGKMQ